MPAAGRAARVDDIHAAATALPEVTVEGEDRPVYQVAGKSFVFFRGPRPDAVDAETGDRLTDVVVFWVADEADKTAMVEDVSTPYFTTPHFRGHRSVLLRESRVGELSREEIEELVQDAWLARAPKRLAKAWLADRDAPSEPS